MKLNKPFYWRENKYPAPDEDKLERVEHQHCSGCEKQIEDDEICCEECLKEINQLN